MPRVAVRLSGPFDQRAAEVDGRALVLAGAPGTAVAEVEESAGKHRLRWAVTGPPGHAYAIQLDGASAWSRDDLRFGEDGQAFGSHEFEVQA